MCLPYWILWKSQFFFTGHSFLFQPLPKFGTDDIQAMLHKWQIYMAFLFLKIIANWNQAAAISKNVFGSCFWFSKAFAQSPNTKWTHISSSLQPNYIEFALSAYSHALDIMSSMAALACWATWPPIVHGFWDNYWDNYCIRSPIAY